MPGAELKGMVVVVPPLAESKDTNPPVVPAEVACNDTMPHEPVLQIPKQFGDIPRMNFSWKKSVRCNHSTHLHCSPGYPKHVPHCSLTM